MSGEGPLVWVTRARPGAAATAARLRERGARALVAPLLEVRPLGARVDLDGVAALAFTSANAVTAFAALERGGRDLPVFAVGDATAEAARGAGYGTVESAGGDVGALAELIARRSPRGGVLHPCAAEPAGDLPGLLAGLATVRPLAVYETVAVPPPAEALSAWADLDAVLLHSPKGAHAFGAGTRGWPPRAIAILCLSQAVAAALAGVYPRFSVAPYPEEGALLNLLDATGP